MSTHYMSGTLKTGYMSLAPCCSDGNRNLSQDNQDLFISSYEDANYQGHPKKPLARRFLGMMKSLLVPMRVKP